jgi:putative peptidoglycan lipid II flippase
MKYKEIEKESYIKAAFNNTLIGFVSRIITYLSFMLIAYIFGTQLSTDIYYLGISFVVAVSGVFTILIIHIFSPILIKLRTQVSYKSAISFASSVMSWTFLLAGGLCLAICLFSVTIFSNISKFNPQSLQINQSLLLYFGFILFFTIAVEFMRVFIQSMGYFTTTAIISLLQSIILIVCIASLSGMLKVQSLAIGTLLSLIIQFFLLYKYILINNHRLYINFAFNNYLKKMLIVGIPLWIAHLVTMGATYYNDFIASGLQTGVLTAMSFAQRIYLLPILIIVAPIQEVINIKISESYFINKQLLITQYIKIIKILFFLLVPITFFIIIFRYEIVHILFVRGKFGVKDAEITANCLGIYSIMIVTTSFSQISARVMYTLQKTGWLSFFGSIGYLFVIVGATIFAKCYGYIGIPFSRVLVELFYFVPYCLIFMYYFLDKMDLKKIGLPFFNFAACSIFILLVLKYFLYKNIIKLLDSIISINLAYLIALSTTSICFIIMYYAIHKRFQNMELTFLVNAVISRIKK